MRDFTCGDVAPSPVSADGDGPSLVRIAPRASPDPGDPLNGRASFSTGGTPWQGEGTPSTGDVQADSDGGGPPGVERLVLAVPIPPGVRQLFVRTRFTAP